MATSLADQLKRLAIPQTRVFTDDKQRASLLFDPLEAAKLSRDAVHSIGCEGLTELIAIEPSFEEFRNTLFGDDTKFMQRAVETKEVNKKLDKQISKFCIRLSPYLLLKSAHKALEWLICRYHVHEVNDTQLFALSLPYHEANIFVRILQVMNLSSNFCKSWTWLEPLQKQGVHLPKQVLVTHAISDSSFLRFICESTQKSIKEHVRINAVARLRTQLAFYTSTLVSVFSRGPSNDQVLTVTLPSLLAGLSSSVPDYKAASYMVFGQLFANNQLDINLTTKVLLTIMEGIAGRLENQRVYILLLIMQRQESPPVLNYDLVRDWEWIVPVLVDLGEAGVLVGPLVISLVEALLDYILHQTSLESSEQDISAQVFCWNLLQQVLCDDVSARKLLWILSSRYDELKRPVEHKGKKRKQSDDDVDVTESEHIMWLKALIETFCIKYSFFFEKVLDRDFQQMCRQWMPEGSDELDTLTLSLVRKCSSSNNSDAWTQLKHILLKNISSQRYFNAWCKAAPPSEPLTLLILVERLLRPTETSSSRRLLLSKMTGSLYDVTSHPVNSLKASFENNPNVDVKDALETVISLWKQSSSSRLSINQWMTAIFEMRSANQFVDLNGVWPFALRMLIYSIPEEATTTVSMEIAATLGYISTTKLKAQVHLISELIDRIKLQNISSETWFDLSSVELAVALRIKALELCFHGQHASPKLRRQFFELITRLLNDCFPSYRSAIEFVSTISSGLPYPCPTSDLISSLLQIHSIHYLWDNVTENEEVTSHRTQFVCHLLMALSHDSKSVREAAVKWLKHLKKMRSKKIQFGKMLSELHSRSEEIISDVEQVSVGMCYLLSSDGRNAEDDLTALNDVLTSTETPLYVAAKLVVLTESVAFEDNMKVLAPLARRALEQKGSLHVGNTILKSYWHRLNSTSAGALEDPVVWKLAEDSMSHYKCDELCPAVTIIKVINKDLFGAVSPSRQIALLKLMIRARSETESASVSSSVASVGRKLPLTGDVVLPLLEEMINSLPKNLTSQSNIQEGLPWRLGISLLEVIQGKKKLYEAKVLVRPLFTLLKFCLDQEEQTPFEYTKQLVLGCLLDLCERHLSAANPTEVATLDVELIVQCLRASSNPQTHHHALLLLSCLGSLIPMQVMHNMMAIFTFMGSSVARLDDEHSVQVVTQVVDTIVPVLVQSLQEGEGEGLAVMAEVLRIFVWTLRDIPQHRRSPLFERLISTLQPDRALAPFLLLLFENYVAKAHKEKGGNAVGNMPPSLQLGMELALSFGPAVVLNSALKLIQYIIAIPPDEMSPSRGEERMETEKKSDGLFDIGKHTPKQLRHYAYTLVTFLNSLLADQALILQVRELDLNDAEKLESMFKDAMAALLLYAPTCTAAAQKNPQLTKYWKVMATLAYDLLDRLVALISSNTLVGVITKLIKHSEDALRRKAMDLLNVHVQTHRGGFSAEEKASLRKLLTPVLNVATTQCSSDASADAQAAQQDALLSLRLLAKVLAAEEPDAFRLVLKEVCKLSKSKGNLLASAALTIADLVAHLKARAVSELPSFLPALLKALSKYTDAESTDIVLMSLCAALYRVVESLAAFLSPYMDNLLYCVSCLATCWPDAADLNRKLAQIRQKVAMSVPHRVLSPSLGRCYQRLMSEGRLSQVGPLLALLSDSLSAVRDVSRLLPDLTPFFMQILQLRSDAAAEQVQFKFSPEDILQVEGFAIDALLVLVLKLSEMSFKPLYYQIFHWASQHPHRSVTFYRLSSKLAEGLKGLFVLFAGHFLQNAASLLDTVNVSKTKQLPFGSTADGEATAVLLLEAILQTLQTVFMYDSTHFLSKDKFQTLLSPLVDQLENTLGGVEELNERSRRLLTPCLAHMTLATDDTQWKQLNYQLLSKTHSPSPLVRIAALNTIVEVAAKLGEEYMPLLPETIGSLAELLEDEDERVEEAMKEALRRMEDDLGHPIREYFQ